MRANAFIPRTCLDYLQHGVTSNGYYWLFDNKDNRFMTYCDLSSEPNAAWTLIMSWNLGSKNLPSFQTKSLTQDVPINQNNPNWDAYRQTLARMKSVQSHSTHWRATCSFNRPDFQNLRKSIDYRDYLRGKFSSFDIMNFVGSGQCKPVEYVNIRGHVAGGAGATAKFWQASNTWLIHIDSRASGCTFAPIAGAVSSEDNFGFYGNVNNRFRCTAGTHATTQWWVGGYMSN